MVFFYLIKGNLLALKSMDLSNVSISGTRLEKLV